MVLKNYLILVLFLLKASLAWGFFVAPESTGNLDQYLQQAQELKLSQDPQWIRLGHYEKTWLGGHKSKIRGSFFLSSRGSTQPDDELKETLRVLYSQDRGQQCRYLARHRWLASRLNLAPSDIYDCPERDEWKKRLNAQEVYIVFAANDLNSAASSFGHTFLRLHNPHNVSQLQLLDYGVNFAAETGDTDGALFALKGLFGSYPGFYSMMPFHQKMKEYVNLEGRDLWEYRLNLSPDQVAMIIDHLLELEGSYVPYYFLDDNCSFQLLKLLEVARPDLDLSSRFLDVTIPIDTLKVLGEQKDFLGPEARRPSLQSEFLKEYKALDKKQKNELQNLVRVVDQGTPPKILQKPAEINATAERRAVLDAALKYLSFKEIQQKDLDRYKQWKYQLFVERSRLGAGELAPESSVAQSPLVSQDSSAFYLSYGQRSEKDFINLKFRRAFHDFLSSDAGVSPFSHLEVLSLSLKYFSSEKRTDLESIKLLNILSTRPVTAFGSPFSWKADIGTRDKFNPFLSGGFGYSFDTSFAETGRWTSLLAGRAFRQNEKDKLAAGVENYYLQKLNQRWRILGWAHGFGANQQGPIWEAGTAFSFDIKRNLEFRGSFERIEDQNEWKISVIF